MVYTGRPSRGCDICRRRCIKCDEAEPSCSYCQKRFISCSGSKPQFDVAWRDQNLVAEKSVQRRQNATKKNRKTQRLGFLPVEISRVLPQDRAAYAVDFSFYICLPKEQDVHRNVLDCLYPIWTKSNITSPLRPIVTAVALVLFEAWSRLNPNRRDSLSRSHYTAGVAALRKSVRHLGLVSNETIMSASMLDMYDNVFSFLTGQRNGAPHMSGTTAMIESRRRQPHADEISQKLILGTRSQIAGRALSSTQEISPIVTTWSQGITHLGTAPGFRLDELNLELANVQSLAAMVMHDKETFAYCTLERCIKLEHQFLKWMEDLPKDWLPSRVFGKACIQQSVRDAGCYQDFCDMYRSIFIANTLVSYYSARLKAKIIITICLSHLHSDLASDSLTSAALMIQDLADNICASVPFHLGDRTTTGRLDDSGIQFPQTNKCSFPRSHHAASGAFVGFFLIVPLAELLLPGIVLRTGQKPWIGRQISRIRQIYSVESS